MSTVARCLVVALCRHDALPIVGVLGVGARIFLQLGDLVLTLNEAALAARLPVMAENDEGACSRDHTCLRQARAPDLRDGQGCRRLR